MNSKKIQKIVSCVVIFAAVISASVTPRIANAATSDGENFSWDNATVYFALTDRFNNGDTSNDHSYGRGLDKSGNIQAGYTGNPGAFQGGDLKGLTQKIKDGYFTDLGVNAIWITPPYEQIHGFTSGNDAGGQAGSNGKGFPYYGYHGYWALDYTNIDANMGTAADFKNFVDAAHEKGIRVVMDIVLNHVGYTTMKDANEYNFGGLASGWENYYYGPLTNLVGGDVEENTYYDKTSSKWASNWWGSDFVRASAGYSGYPAASKGAGWTESLAGLPDIKTESTTEVSVPPLLVNKWKSEGRYDKEVASLNQFFQERNLPKTPRNYVIKWLTDYIRQYGVDGFRCDTANQVDLDSWAALNKEAEAAFQEYKAKNPDKVLDEDAQFWTVGESWGHGTTKSAFYTQSGFDAMINFGFKGANTSNIQAKYNDLSKVNDDDTFNVLSYISSHDDVLSDRNSTIDGGTSLLLAPGAVQIYYGDETARPLGWTDRFTSDYKDQCFRTFMNWSDLNNSSSTASKSLKHWQKLGQFRNNHLSVGAGSNIDLNSSPYTFGRVYNNDGVLDKVVCEVGGSGTVDVKVSGIFADGALVRDAYTGNTTTVVNGKATFIDGGNKVILIEKGDNSPEVSVGPSKTKYFTDTLDLTLYVSGADSGTYSLNGGEEKLFVNGDKLTIGAGLNYEDATTITVQASNSDGKASQSYTYTKKDPNFVSKVYFKKPSNWGTPKAYVYSESAGAVKEIAKWPGSAMTDEGDSLYSYSLPAGFTDALVIFTDGKNQTSGVGQSGLVLEDGSVMIYDNGNWSEYDEGVKASISPASTSFIDSQVLTLGAKNYKSATYSINGEAEVPYNNGDKITIGEDADIGDVITVTLKVSNDTKTDVQTYTYTKTEKIVIKDSKIYCKKPSNWGTLKAYIYNEDNGVKTVAAWPGVEMTSECDNLYSYTLKDWEEDAYIIFTDGKNQTPASGQKGYKLSNGSSMIYDNGNWTTYVEEVKNPTVSISKEDSTFIDSLTLTLKAENYTSATYSINGGAETSYINGDSITIGKDAAVNDKITVTLKASNDTKAATKTYTYTKIKVEEIESSKIYCKKPSNWGTLKAYIYNEDSGLKTVAAWPGVEMTLEGNNLYSYTLKDWKVDAYVIFTDGKNQTPGSGQKGYKLSNGSSMIYDNGSWSAYVEEVKNPTVSISKEDSTFVDSLTLTLGAANYTSAAYSINGGAETIYTNGDSMTIGKDAAINDEITVTLKSTNGTTTATKTYTYTKVEEKIASSKIYCKKPSNWGTLKVYIYNEDNGLKTVAAWPGVEMTSEGDNLYSYTLKNWEQDAYVIFTDGKNQTPGSGQKGYKLTNGSSMIYDNGSWSQY